jgi:MFS family permease
MLIAFRFVLGVGVGGDYPVSAVMVSEYANRKDRGKLVGMVFGTQALGLTIGPLIALALLGSGASDDLAWRILLGLGAVPAAAVVYLRCRMPESPRYKAHVQAQADQATMAADVSATNGDRSRTADLRETGLRAFLANRRWLVTLAGTAGCWFLLDYAYYGNTISTPQILGLISPGASIMTKIALQLAIFVVAAVPGYILAIARVDRIGHRKLQLIGFAMMALCFLIIAAVPGMTTAVAPFLIVYGVSYFFTEFGPNMTTFVLPSELFPVKMRTTGHGISAGIGKLGAFIGVFLFPILQTSLGLRGTLLLTAGVSVLGLALTLVLPEPAGRSLDDITNSIRDTTLATQEEQAAQVWRPDHSRGAGPPYWPGGASRQAADQAGHAGGRRGTAAGRSGPVVPRTAGRRSRCGRCGDRLRDAGCRAHRRGRPRDHRRPRGQAGLDRLSQGRPARHGHQPGQPGQGRRRAGRPAGAAGGARRRVVGAAIPPRLTATGSASGEAPFAPELP